jgi:tripartite-type tricarboxylate transporter receptor subunit TctC
MIRKAATATVFFVAMMTQHMSVHAQSVQEFYTKRLVTLQIGSGVGGGYDVIGRLFTRHMGKFIPGNPTVAPQNVPGGGSLQLANQFANITARDGSVFGIFNTGMALTPLLTPSAVKFDPRKFNFIGSPAREAHVLIVWHTAPVQTIEDAFKTTLTVAATAPGGAPYEFPHLTNTLLGSKFKVIKGYRSSQASKLAMEREEVHGIAGHGWASVKAEYGEDLAAGRIKVVAAFGMKKHKDLENIPLFPTGSTEEERRLFALMYSRQVIGRPFAAPQDVPKDRLEALRNAYAATVKDPAFLAEANKFNVDIDPVYHDELNELIDELYATPQSVVARMQAILKAAD